MRNREIEKKAIKPEIRKICQNKSIKILAPQSSCILNGNKVTTGHQDIKRLSKVNHCDFSLENRQKSILLNRRQPPILRGSIKSSHLMIIPLSHNKLRPR